MVEINGELRMDASRAFEPPDVSEQPFAPPIECMLDIPVPPSVNVTRMISRRALPKLAAWKAAADKILMASGQYRAAWRNIPRYELTVILNEKLCRLDPDNALKNAIDYLCRLEIVQDDAPINVRQILIKWGEAPEGMRLIVRPCT